MPEGAVVLSGAPTLPGLVLLAELGRGHDTVVYRARRVADDGVSRPDYAVKVLGLDASVGAEVLCTFRREAALLACVDHPGVVRVHSVGELNDRPYLVMELVEGRALADVLHAGPLTEETTARLGAAIADALGAAHLAGLVHRDIKPHNVMVQADGRPMLIDFGLARGRRTPGTGQASGDSDIVAGTVAYCPPEQSGLLHRPVDARSDLYSLGVVLYECVTGRLPFVAANPGELLRLHATTPAPDPRTFRPGVSAGLASVLFRALAKDPDDRYPSAGALAADLRRLLPEPAETPTQGQATSLDARSPAPLVGRERELATLLGHWQRVKNGTGALVIIQGPTGIGKSRLADELTATVGEQPVLVVRAMAGAAPLAALRAAVEQHVRSVERLPAAAMAAAIRRLTTAARPVFGLLKPLSPALAGLLALPEPAADEPGHQFPSAVATFLAEFARSAGGLLIRVEDAELLDAGSQRVLEYLFTDRARTPLLVLATDVGGTDLEQVGLQGLVDERIVLGPLPAAAVSELVERLSGRMDLGAAFATRLANASAGNPMAVLQYFQAAIDGGLVRPSWGTWLIDLDGLAGVALPIDAMQLLVSRLAGLTSPARTILVAAAALGVRFDPVQLNEVTGSAPADVVATLDEAARLHVIERRGAGDYAFVHAGIREALLTGADPQALSAIHQRAAELLGAAEHADSPAWVYTLAWHRLNGLVDYDPDAVVQACMGAARQALADSSPTEAVGYLDHVRQIVESYDLPLPAEYAEMIGTALHQSGQYADALRWLRHGIEEESDPFKQARLLIHIGQVELSRWYPAAAEEAFHRALRVLCRPMPRNRALLVVSTALAIVTAALPGRSVTGAARDRLRLVVKAYLGLGTVAVIAVRLHRKPDYVFRAVPAAMLLGPGPEYVQIFSALGVVHAASGREAAARRAFAKAETAADQLGQSQSTAELMFALQQARYRREPVSGERAAALLSEQGRWLELFPYLTCTAVFCWQRLFGGHVTIAKAAYERGLRRLVLSDEDDVAYLLLGAAIAAAGGRASLAAEQYRAASEAFAARGVEAAGLRMSMAQTAMQIGVESGEVGKDFDAAAADFAALGRPLNAVLSVHFGAYVYQAYGRLEQCRRGGSFAAAVRAVGMLEVAAHSRQLRAHARVARAELDRLGGAVPAALDAVLGAAGLINAAHSPLAEYEASRVRARCQLFLGEPGAARRAALDAADLATEHGWPHRADWIRAEFGLVPAATADVRTLDWEISDSTADRERLTALEQINKAASSVLDPAQLIRIGLDESIRILGAERGLLFLTDEQSGRLALRLGRSARHEDLDDPSDFAATLVERVRQTRRELVVTGTDDGAALGSDSVLIHGLRSVVVAPVELDGRLLGVVYLDSRIATGVFRPRDARILTTICGHVAAALETARAAQLAAEMRAVQQERDIAELLRTAMTAVSGTLDPAAVLTQLHASLARVLPADESWFSEGGSRGLDGPAVVDGPAGLNGLVGLDGLVPGLADEKAFGSWLVVPLATPGAPIGVVVLAAKEAGVFRESHVGMAAALIAHGMIAYQNAVLFRRVEELATVDSLTGTASRRHFFERGTEWVATGRRLAALMVDIDHFKSVNDTYGHATGDQVIAAVAERLGSVLGPDDLLGRYGGEEFAIVLTPAIDGQALTIGEQLRAAVAQCQVETAIGPLSVTVSIGIAERVTGEDLAGLLGRADAALYQAKRSGRNQVSTATTGN